ncbi:helix-turn-helix domain-containing protein [Chitinophagaceae bacterium 26-R-25]|nr:helix-turn-helix domain-containing protein [Chitinophagaceae bacterium 26-R-25]
MNKMIIVEEDQLRQIVSESVKQALHNENAPTKTSPKEPEPLLTREQMAKELHISLVTITDWMKKGLPYLRLHGRIYFLRSEVMTSMKQNRLSSSM